MEKRLLNIKEAAEYLGVSPKTLYNWISEKKVPYVKVGYSVKFDLKRIDELIQKNTIEPHSIY